MMAAVVLAIFTSSCAPTEFYQPSVVDYRDQAGGVLLSVNSIGRWEEVADALKPNFSLANGDAAFTKVLPVTARIQKQTLDAVGASLGIGISGAVPTVPSGTPAGGEMPANVTIGTDIGIDPLLQYKAAESLYQAVQLMNREVELAAQRKGYRPYMVRMQLINIPYRRHLPYDVYAQVSFFPSCVKTNTTKLPYVVPLIVTDDLEQALKSRAAEIARQIGLAVGVVASGVGANIGTNWEKRNRDSVLAADVNSLLTVGRMNDNGIYIRLGAANEATGEYSMVGRTYDIAVLLLVPEEYFSTDNTGNNTSDVPIKIARSSHTTETPIISVTPVRKNDINNVGSGIEIPVRNTMNLKENKKSSDSFEPENKTKVNNSGRVILSVITHTDLRNALTGELLRERRDETLVTQVDNAFERTLRIGYKDMYVTWTNTTDEVKLNIAKKLISPIQRSDYGSFYKEAYSIKLNPDVKEAKIEEQIQEDGSCKEGNPANNEYRLACISPGYLNSLWGYLASVTIESSTKSASLELPPPQDIVIPSQTALLRDDGKEKMDVVLRGVSGITSKNISAVLQLAPGDKKDHKNRTSDKKTKSYDFPAEAIKVDSMTSTLALQFPSPAKWNLVEIDYAKSQLIIESREEEQAKVEIKSPFAVLHAVVPVEKQKPGFDFRASISDIMVEKGAGTVKLVFDKFEDDSAELTWSGAEVVSAKDSKNEDVKLALDKITIASATELTLKIQNAKTDNKVVFKAVGKKKNQETNKVEKTGEVSKEFNVVASK